MRFSKYAVKQMRRRRIPESDAAVVAAWPAAVHEGRNGIKACYGQGPVSGYRIRVTVGADGVVKTVAWADWRKPGED
ncbi:MAG TPA: hypothetical protein VFW34_11785 [Candidatus Rubrimentiphilum sp.]|nr:hypothetical protein [Candidatus Rubrimentiphilum sp.]